MSFSRVDRVRELFAAALAIAPSERAALLTKACSSDLALRREVEELLALDASDPDSGGLTQGAGSEWLATDLAIDTEENESLPSRIGSFEILRELGRGGMGIVYEAQQEEPLRRVALKVIHPGLISRSLLRRFRQETRALAQLRHPGIAQIYEAGTSLGGEGAASRPYFVMELVEGPTLLNYATEAGLDTPARLELIARVCDALHHAHQKGVVHRDLKPENILVQSADPSTPDTHHTSVLSSAIQPKILDFGVSRFAEEHDSRSVHTQSGQIVGTVPYLSPEQAAGDSAVADIRSDVYSMGIVAFQLLSSTLPFDTAGRTVRAATRVILEESPRRLGSASADFRGDIETIVHKAMNRDPQLRYQSAADMAADIRRYLAQQPIAARPSSAAYALRKFAQRNRALAVVGSASLLLIVGALVIMSMLWESARRANEQAVWQRYRSAMSAASFALTKGEIGIARRQLESTAPRYRGWEYRHLLSRLDQSTSVATPRMSKPFMFVPGTSTEAGIVMVEPHKTRELVRLGDEHSPAAAVDPKLALWYTARASRATHTLKSVGPIIYTPDPESGGPVPHLIAEWPFGADEVLDNPVLSDDGQLLVMLSRRTSGSSLVLIDLSANRVRLISLDPDVFPFRAAVSGDGRRAAISTTFNQRRPPFAQVFDTRTGVSVSMVADLASEARTLLLNRDGSRLIAAFHGGPMGSWDIALDPARSLVRRPFNFDSIENLNFNADQTLLGGGNIDGVVRVFDAATLENTHSLIGHESEVHDVRFLPLPAGGLISAGRDGSVRRWNLSRRSELPMVLCGHTHLVHALAIGSAGHFVATGSWDKTVRLFSLDTGREFASMPTGTFVQALSLSPDDRTIVTREYNGDVRIFDVSTCSQTALIDDRPSSLDQQLFDQNSKRILFDFNPATRTATFFDISSRNWSALPSDQIATVRGSTVNNSASIIARSETRDRWFGTVLYDFRTGREILSIPARRTANESIAFSPDGRTVVAPDDDHHIQAYEVPSGRHIGTFAGHAREVLALVFSPDGSRLFSADYTGTIWIWDTNTREELTQLRGHGEHVRRLAVSPDGTIIVSGARDGTARVWTAPKADLSRSVLSAHSRDGSSASLADR